MSILVQRSDVGEFRRRYRWMVLVVLAAFGVLVGRLFQLQVLEADVHRAQARRNVVREIKLATTRGVIRDAHGEILAANRPSYNVHVVPRDLDMKVTWPRLAGMLKLDPSERAELEKRLREVPEQRKDHQLLLRVDVSRDAVAVLKENEADLPGVELVPVPVRYYPYGELGAHLLGTMREIDPDTLARFEGRGYRSGDQLGAFGVEGRWESYLRGQRGFRRTVRAPRRRQPIQRLEARYLDPPLVVEPIPGRDISLTVDMELERSIASALRGQIAGAVVVVDVKTGRLLAAVSKPSFDPNILSGGSGKKAVRDLVRKLYSDPLRPTLDKTISAAYPPGSTFKPFSALVGLQDRLIDPRTRVDCRGGYEYGRRFFRCTGVHRQVDLHRAIVQSCNTYFYALGQQASIDRLAQVGLEFGFGQKTGIGVNPEAPGRMPTRAWYTRRYRGQFLGGYTLLSAIGQGASTATVLQIALAYAALANRGTLYQPQVVRSIETSDGTVVQEFPPRVRRIVEVDQRHLQLILSALGGVVTEREGTAYRERIVGVDLAGKTGTAQVSHVTPRGVDPDKVWYFNRDHAWFAGYAPAQAPEVAIVVLVEHGGGGGKNAVPVAMRVIRDWQRLKSRRLEGKVLERQRPEGAGP